jgi:hypothetical protein
VSNAAGVLQSIAGGLVANFIFLFVLRASIPPPTILRVENGSVRMTLKKARLSDPIQYDPAVGEVVIKGATIELSWESRTRIHLGLSLVAGVAVFAILLWILVLE